MQELILSTHQNLVGEFKKNKTKQGKRRFQKVCFFVLFCFVDWKNPEEQLSHMLKATDLTCSVDPFVTLDLKFLLSIFFFFVVLVEFFKQPR